MLGGVCRWAFPWGNNANQLQFAFGTHATLEVWVGGGLYDITPTLAGPPRLLGANPLATQNGDTTVTVTDPGHPFETGVEVTVSGVTAVGGITPNGTFTLTVVDSSTYTYESLIAASSTATGGGSAVVVQPTEAFAAGEIDGTGQAGYGTGPYGVGGYATPSTDDYFPRTWSGGAFGQDLIASPRLGTIYRWDADDTGTPAQALQNAPAEVTYALVSAQDAIFALGCNQQADGVWNALCVRHTSVSNATDWTTTTTNSAREYVLPGGGRIVGGRVMADTVLVWTNSALFRFDYLGQLNAVYRFTQVGKGCGLIGPGAAVVVGQTAYWISPDRQFWSYTLGGESQPLPCPIREDFADNLSASQGDKIVASSVAEFGEVWWDYPDSRDGYENSRYVAVPVNGPDAGAWFRGQMARTARVDAGPSPYPLAVTYEGAMYWHERGASADGAALTWFIESADQYLSEEKALLARSFWPDREYQIGAATLTLTTRERPNGPERTRSYAVASTSEKVDLRSSGRLFRYKFAGSSSPAAYRMGRPVFDMVPTGMR